MMPKGWEVKSFEDVAFVGNGQVDPREEPYSSMWHIGPENVTSDTGRIKGVKRCSELGLISGKYEFDKESIVYSKIRPNLNKVCRPDFDGVCSADMYPIWTKEGLCADYLFYYMLGPSFYSTAVSMSMRTGMPKINRTDLDTIKINIPPISEQQKIAKILSTWDKAISTTERLIENSTQQKKAVMQQLLTGKKRLIDESGKPFDKKWERIELGKLLDYKQPTPYLVKSTDYSDEYPTPVLTAGKTFILGYTDEEFGIFSEDLPTIIFDDFTTASKFVGFPFKAKSSAMKMLVAKDGVSIKYIFEVMQALSYAIGGHQRHWISIFANIVIGLPCREEQQKITAVSNNADKEIELLEQQLADLQQEKKALMQQLLTGKKRVLV